MGKRFTDTEKWKKPFMKSLSTVHKLLFLYILDDCDHAGIWHVEPDVANLRLGVSINFAEAKEGLKKHIHIFDNGNKWFIPYFVEFQYGGLNPSVNTHKSVLRRLEQYKLKKYLNQQLINCSQGDQDKDKDKDIINNILKTWNDKMPWKIKSITKDRLKHLKERMSEDGFNLVAICDKILNSEFLMGTRTSPGHENFKADFDWIIKNSTNYIKVLEGKYDNKVKKGIEKWL